MICFSVTSGEKKLGMLAILALSFFSVGTAQARRASGSTLKLQNDGWALLLDRSGTLEECLEIGEQLSVIHYSRHFVLTA